MFVEVKLPIAIRILLRYIQIQSYLWPSRAARWTAVRFLTPQRFERPEKEIKVLQSGRPLYLAGSLKAWSWGQGPRVLLVHGWEGRGSQMGGFVTPLTEAGFSVLTLDGPAHGDSPGQRTNMGDFARMLLKVDQEQGPFVAVIGHSFGTGASLVASRWGLRAKTLILVASPQSIEGIFERYSDFFRLSPKARILFQHYVETEAQLKLADYRIEDMARETKVPVLLVHDRQDKEIPFADAEKRVSQYPHGSFHWTEGLGHRRILWDSRVIEKAVEFIKVGAKS